MQTPADPNLNPSLMLTERIRGLAGRVLGRHIPLVAFVSMLILLSPRRHRCLPPAIRLSCRL